MERKYHDKNWLYDQYITRRRTIKDISAECKTSHQSIEKYLKRFGIQKFPVQKVPLAEEIRELYVERGYGVTKIAEMYPGVGKTTILRIMSENGIETISPGELQSRWWQDAENQKKMSTQRLQWWQNKAYREKAMRHLTDRDAILGRAIKKSATYQGVSVAEWKGFLTAEQTRIRNSQEYAEWRKAVFKRDDYTCQCCGVRSCAGHPVELHAHHLENFAHNEDLRFDVGNGITLCYDCHDIRAHGSFHNLYGIHGNTHKQFEEYMVLRLKENIDDEAEQTNLSDL